MSTLLVFAAASAVLALVPGPSVLFVLARGIVAGRRAAVVSVLGIHTATLCFVASAAAGLTALLASSPVVFGAVRYAGAAYLLWLGVRALRDRTPLSAPAPRPGRTFRQAFLVGISNPKVALFFLAYLPQFVRPDAGAVPVQVLVLGLVFLAVAVVLDLGWALLAGALSAWLRRHPRAWTRRRLVTGPTYLGLGTYAATS